MSDLQAILKAIGKQYKNDKIATLGSFEEDPERLSFGLFALDLATGGGIPLGRCTIIYGPEASVKTTLCLKLVASAQRMFPKRRVVFVDVEGHFSVPWATKMGVDCEKLIMVRPDNSEQTTDIVESLMYADDVSLVVLDSLAAMVTTNELNSSAEKAVVGGALAVNKLYRKMSRVLSYARREGHLPTLVVINQIRSKIGVMYGNPETLPGGIAFKFLASMMIRVYGKDLVVKEVHETLPAYKETKFVVKKWKVPIVSPSGMFVMALQAIAKPPLQIGDSYDWSTVLSYLKSLELLQKASTGNDGWNLIDGETGEFLNYDKQSDIRDRMETDPEFDAKVKADIVKAVLDGGQSLPESESN